MKEAVERIHMFFVINKTQTKTRDEIFAKTGAMLLNFKHINNESYKVDMKGASTDAVAQLFLKRERRSAE